MTDIPPELATFFGRAFERGSEGHNARPTAIEWFNALGRLSTQTHACSADPGHEYWGGAGGCVWCRIANANGPDYFFGVGDSPTTFAVDESRLGGFLARLKAARLLDFPYDRASYEPAVSPDPDPLPDNMENHRAMTAILAMVTGLGIVLVLAGCVSRFALLTGLLITLVFGIWLWLTVTNSPYRREATRRRSALRVARGNLERLEDRWDEILRQYIHQHQFLTHRVQDGVNRCLRFPQEHQSERNSLESRREELARAQYLRTCFISDADIPGIGEGRKQTLAAYNILTAYDVSLNDVMRINGFGPKLAGSLVAWREQTVRQFRFDKSKGVPEADLRGLAAKYRKQQDAFFRDIEPTLAEMEGLEPKARKDLTALVPELRVAVANWWQADRDLEILSSTGADSPDGP